MRIYNRTMTRSYKDDIEEMHSLFRMYRWYSSASDEKRKELLRLRMMMFNEETAETMKAYLARDPEELVDGLIDTIVIAIGTLDLIGVDTDKAWRAVLKANLSKQLGRKPERPNPLGLPDLIKPDGWTAPSHSNNLGDLPALLRGTVGDD